MNENDVLRMISELRAKAAIAQTSPGQQPPPTNNVGEDFSSLFNKAVDAVNGAQHKAGELKKAFEVGDPQVDLPEVMIASQKAKISFEAMVEVRNKLLDAYREIMQMQV